MEKGLLAFGAFRHDLHIAKGILDIGGGKTTKLKQLGMLAGLAGNQVLRQPHPLLCCVPFAIIAGSCAPQSRGSLRLPPVLLPGPRSTLGLSQLPRLHSGRGQSG